MGKIDSVEPGISNKSATIEVEYSENDEKCKGKLCLNVCVVDKEKVSNKSSQRRLLEEVTNCCWESGIPKDIVIAPICFALNGEQKEQVD